MSLPIPVEALEQHIITLGKTGAGKSSAVRDLVEYLLDHDKRVIVITPKADWWGLKLDKDGKRAGYPVPVFGGQHQDLPLSHLSGKVMAELLGTGNRSAILQMRDFMPGERTTFWIDFASNLFRVLQGKIYLVIDEVHNFAPKGKVLDNKAGMMLHWSNKLAAEARGIGITLIGASQRASKVHNDFLTSCETLIAMRVTTKWDRDAVRDWIEGCGDSEKGKEVLNSLAQMKRGDAWAWSPEIDFGPKQIHFPMFKTYDSFRPQSPADTAKLHGWAGVDLADLKTKLEHVVKEAEANDPVKLKAEISRLRLELARKPQPVPQKAERLTVASSTIQAALSQHIEPWRVSAQHFRRQLVETRNMLTSIIRMATKYVEEPLADYPKIEIDPKVIKQSIESSVRTFTHKVKETPFGHVHTTEVNGDLSGPEARILKALAELRQIGQEAPPRDMVAAWSTYSPTSSAFKNPLGALNTKGFVGYPHPGHVNLTDEGERVAPHVNAVDRTEIERRIQHICSGPEWKILEPLTGGVELARRELALASGYSETSSAFKNPLGALKTKGLVTYPRQGHVKIAAWFLEL